MDYFKNIELALALGFKEIPDEKAYRGKFYIKQEKIWIHAIEAIKYTLQVDSDEALRNLNYDVDTYYKYVNYTNKMTDQAIEHIKISIMSNDSPLSARYDLLHNPEILIEMAGLLEEGFDDEILADYAHQMSKR